MRSSAEIGDVGGDAMLAATYFLMKLKFKSSLVRLALNDAKNRTFFGRENSDLWHKTHVNRR